MPARDPHELPGRVARTRPVPTLGVNPRRRGMNEGIARGMLDPARPAPAPPVNRCSLRRKCPSTQKFDARHASETTPASQAPLTAPAPASCGSYRSMAISRWVAARRAVTEHAERQAGGRDALRRTMAWLRARAPRRAARARPPGRCSPFPPSQRHRCCESQRRQAGFVVSLHPARNECAGKRTLDQGMRRPFDEQQRVHETDMDLDFHRSASSAVSNRCLARR